MGNKSSKIKLVKSPEEQSYIITSKDLHMKDLKSNYKSFKKRNSNYYLQKMTLIYQLINPKTKEITIQNLGQFPLETPNLIFHVHTSTKMLSNQLLNRKFKKVFTIVKPRKNRSYRSTGNKAMDFVYDEKTELLENKKIIRIYEEDYNFAPLKMVYFNPRLKKKVLIVRKEDIPVCESKRYDSLIDFYKSFLNCLNKVENSYYDFKENYEKSQNYFLEFDLIPKIERRGIAFQRHIFSITIGQFKERGFKNFEKFLKIASPKFEDFHTKLHVVTIIEEINCVFFCFKNSKSTKISPILLNLDEETKKFRIVELDEKYFDTTEYFKLIDIQFMPKISKRMFIICRYDKNLEDRSLHKCAIFFKKNLEIFCFEILEKKNLQQLDVICNDNGDEIGIEVFYLMSKGVFKQKFLF